MKNYGGAIAAGALSGATIIGIRTYTKNVERDYRQRQCVIFCEYLKNMKKIHGDSFSKEDAFNRKPQFGRLHECCDCK